MIPSIYTVIASTDPTVTNTLVITVGSVIVAALGIVSAVLLSRKPQPVTPVVKETSLPSAASFNGTQMEFMELVVQRHNALDTKLGETNENLETVKQELDDERQYRRRFESAVQRYLTDIAAAWPGPGSIPYPADEDFDTLRPALPSSITHGRRRTV